MEPLKFPETDDVCEIDADDAPPAKAGLTGINCAGFGSAMVVTATFGMVAAGHVLQKLADEVTPAAVADAALS